MFSWQPSVKMSGLPPANYKCSNCWGLLPVEQEGNVLVQTHCGQQPKHIRDKAWAIVSSLAGLNKGIFQLPLDDFNNNSPISRFILKL